MGNQKSPMGNEILILAFRLFEVGVVHRFKEDYMIVLFILSEDPVYEHLFTNYPFDIDGNMPFSKAISDALGQMIASDVAGTLSGESKTIIFLCPLEKRYSHIIEEKFPDESDRQLVESFSRAFYERVLGIPIKV